MFTTGHLSTDVKVQNSDTALGNLGTTGSSYGNYQHLPSVAASTTKTTKSGFNTVTAKAPGISTAVAPAETTVRATPKSSYGSSNNPNACRRCGKTVYAAESPIKIAGLVFHKKCFTDPNTGTLLSLRTATIGVDSNGDKDVFLSGSESKSSLGPASTPHKPYIPPNQVEDVITARVGSVPDSNMRTTDRKFNVAGKAEDRSCRDADMGSAYGTDAVGVINQTTVDKPPTTVQNANLKEKLHNGKHYRGASEQDQADTGSAYGANGRND
jgi:hypothetical protein